VNPGKLNVGPDHISCIPIGEYVGNQDDSLPYAKLFEIQMVDDYFAEIVQFFSIGIAPYDMTIAHKK